jgi:hypothetical protein
MPSALLVTGLPQDADETLVQSICAEFDGFGSLVVDASTGHAVLVFDSEHSAAVAQVALAGYNLAGHILSCVPFESDTLVDPGDQILIPIRNTTDQFVSLERKNLPRDVEDVAGILKGELPPLRVWIDVAMAYVSPPTTIPRFSNVHDACTGTMTRACRRRTKPCFKLQTPKRVS